MTRTHASNEVVALPRGGAIDKIAKYGWKVADQPGNFMMIDKRDLHINEDYQRDGSLGTERANAIAAAWSWMACGVLIVALREKKFWTVDGQHRQLAALKRSDITHLPCLVFTTTEAAEEAGAFKRLNCARKSVASTDQFRASLVALDPLALFVKHILDQNGVVWNKSGRGAKHLRSVAWAMTAAKTNPDAFKTTVALAAQLCEHRFLHEQLLAGLFYLETAANLLGNADFVRRLKKLGADKLIAATQRASAYHARGGMKVWAHGLVDEANKGLRNRFTLDEHA